MDSVTRIIIGPSTDGKRYHVNWKHVDGPLMVLADATLHWLTWRERIALKFKCTTLDKIHNKRLAKSMARLPNNVTVTICH